jgi:Putative amidoligase enzyme
MNYRELQQTLKAYRASGLTTIKLNQKTAVLQAEYDRIQSQQTPQATRSATNDLPDSLTFGVEIEVTRLISQDAIAQALQAAGIAAEVENYNYITQTHWKVITDGSCGYEIVSPILSGEKGIAELRKVCEALTQAGCKVNKNCGLHVHLGADFLGVARVRNFVKRYIANEANLDAIQPKARRGSANPFCLPTSETMRTHLIDNCLTIDDMRQLQHSRYSKVNLQSYRKYGTIEIRHHAGTTDATKITNWVRFLIGFATTATPTNATSTDFNEMFSNNNIATFYRRRRAALAA